MAWLRRMWNREFDQYSNDDNYNWEVQHFRYPLDAAGLWPKEGRTNRMRFVICLTMLVLFLTLPQLTRLFFIEDETQLFICISLNLRNTLVIVTTFCLVSNLKVLQSIIEEMRENWTTDFSDEDRKIMHHYARYSTKISWIFVAAKVFLHANRCFNQLDQAVARGKNWAMIDGGFWYPFLSNPYVVTPCYLFHVIAYNVGVIILHGVDVFVSVCTSHTCGQLIILGNKIKKYEGQIHHSLGEYSPGKCCCLKCIVDFHVKICEFVNKINSLLSTSILVRFLATVFYICCVGFEFSKAMMIRDYRSLMINASQTSLVCTVLFILCWIAEMCQQKSYALGDIAYCTQWMAKDPKISQNLIFIIRRSRIPLKITAGKFYVLSLSLFKEFLFTTWSYISVLITIKLDK